MVKKVDIKLIDIRKEESSTKKSTRESIIHNALILFSERGYEGVSMRDIACAVGIKAASIYNHFKSKEEIFDTIIDQMMKRYEEAAKAMELPQGDMGDISKQYSALTKERLIEQAKGLFLFFLKDDYAARFRKMLIVEQYRNEKARLSFVQFLIDSAISFQTGLFMQMMNMSHFKQLDPEMMAYHFYAPIYLLLNKYDGSEGTEDEALKLLERHVIQFNRIYLLEKQQVVYDLMKRMNINYKLIQHKAVYTIDELWGLDLPDTDLVAKNLFVRDDKKSNYYLLVVKQDKKVELKDLKEKIGSRPLSFASEADLDSILGLSKGAVTPLGIINDNDLKVKVIIDMFFYEQGIGIHPNENNATIWLKVTDLVNIIKQHGNMVEFAEI